jgi:hypothetical protein
MEPYNRNRMISSVRAGTTATLVAATLVFAYVQDRVTASGAQRYVSLQHQAMSGQGAPITIDEIMRPAIAGSVRQGLLWAGGVLVLGCGVTGIARRRA